MNLPRALLIAILLTLSQHTFGQFLNGGTVQESDLSDWSPNDISDFFGVYKFGDNIQSKVTFRVIGFQNSVIVQVESYYKYEANMNWDHNFMNLNNPRINLDGTFSCDEFKGKFLTYQGFDQEKNVLKINEAFTFFDDQAYELGSRIGNTNYKLKGRFTEASTEPLDPKELHKMSSADLKLMRNEIFARYGYKFKPGGEMDGYFSRQSWYKPEFTDVNEYLTTLELHNIELIRAGEQRP